MGTRKKETASPPPDRVISVRVLADIHKRARVYALQQDTTFQAVLNEALDEYLRKRGA